MPRSYQGNYGSRFGRDDPRAGKRSFDKPFLSYVMEADPAWQRDRKREVEYRFGQDRVFIGDPATRGPYGDS